MAKSTCNLVLTVFASVIALTLSLAIICGHNTRFFSLFFGLRPEEKGGTLLLHRF